MKMGNISLDVQLFSIWTLYLWSKHFNKCRDKMVTEDFMSLHCNLQMFYSMFSMLSKKSNHMCKMF